MALTMIFLVVGLVMSFVVVLMLRSVNWVVMNRNGDNMRLHDDWVWDFDWDMDGVGNLNFLNHWHFNLLVDRELFGVMMMDGVDLVRDLDFDCFTANNKRHRKGVLSA